MDISFQAIGPAGPDLRRFQEALRQADVRLVTGHDPRVTCPGLVYFTGTSREVLSALRDPGSADGEPTLVIVGRGTTLTSEFTWELMHAGASDVITWDACDDPVRAVVSRLERWREIDELVRSVTARGDLVGTGARWIALLREVVEVARFTRASVLLTGESGTGKELVARLIHELDSRPRKKDLIVLDCATVVPSLSGSEFFGHEKGAFTGAAGPRDGAFALADGGTLFLDEVGELPPNLQAELLRVIQEGTYKRVGSNTWHTTDFRLIAATNRDLAADQKAGRFRLDLYYRIAAWQFRLPSLHERREDIAPLARSFLARALANGAVPAINPAVQALLLNRDYPGNVRELRQLVERIAQRHVGAGPVTPGDVPDDERPVASAEVGPWAWHGDSFEGAVRQALREGADLKEITRVAAETAISIAVADSDGSLAKAAQSLGVTPRALQLRRAAGRLAPAEESA